MRTKNVVTEHSPMAKEERRDKRDEKSYEKLLIQKLILS